MDDFHYQQGEYHCEEASVENLARAYGTPLYVYSRRTLMGHFTRIRHAFAEADPLICYSVKANGNLSVLAELHRAGAGMDIVSGGELARALAVGVPGDKIVYAGVGKKTEEIRAALKAGILMFNVESEPELRRINRVAGTLKTSARVALRLNPDVDAKTHHYITTGKKENKFGLSIPFALGLFQRAKRLRHVEVVGLHMHLGSQITRATPYLQAIKRLQPVIADLRAGGHRIEYLNVGGGLGIIYDEEHPQTADAFARAVQPLLAPLNCRLILEPGRFIMGNAGVLVTQVQYVKRGLVKTFIVVDAGMNDLLRPSLYNAYHHVLPARRRRAGRTVLSDVVGPISSPGISWARTGISRRARKGIPWAAAAPAPTACPWRRTTTAAPAPRRCWSAANGPTSSAGGKRFRISWLPSSPCRG